MLNYIEIEKLKFQMRSPKEVRPAELVELRSSHSTSLCFGRNVDKIKSFAGHWNIFSGILSEPELMMDDRLVRMSPENNYIETMSPDDLPTQFPQCGGSPTTPEI